MATEPMSIRINAQLKKEFQETIKGSGLSSDQFITTLIGLYKEPQSEESAAASQEKRQLRTGFKQLQTLVEAVIDRAENQELQAVSRVSEVEQEFSGKAEGFKGQVKDLTDQVERLETENTQLKEDQESREQLKDAFKAQKSSWIAAEELHQVQLDDASIKLGESNAKVVEVSDENNKLLKGEHKLKGDIALLKKDLAKAKTDNAIHLKDKEIDLLKAADAEKDVLRKEYEERLAKAVEDGKADTKERVADIRAQLSEMKQDIKRVVTEESQRLEKIKSEHMELINKLNLDNRKSLESMEAKMEASVIAERKLAEKRVHEVMQIVKP